MSDIEAFDEETSVGDQIDETVRRREEAALEYGDPRSADANADLPEDTDPVSVREPVTHYGEAHAVFDLTKPASDDPEPVPMEMVTIKPQFPLSIAVVGAPGSGKREFAGALAALWAESPPFSENEFRVLGNPGERIQDLDQAVGFFGSDREHLLAFFLGLEDEMKARQDGVSYIINGTVLGNMAHAGANYETVMLGLDSSGIITPETQVRMQRLQAAMTSLTFMIDNFQAKFAFYLPLAPYIEVPGVEQTVDERHAQRVDAALRQVLQGFGFNLQTLDQPTAQERAQVALDTIAKIYTEGVLVPKEIAEAAEARLG